MIKDYNYNLFLKALQKRGVKLKKIGKTNVFIGLNGKRRELFFDLSLSSTSFNTAWIVDDKFFSKKILERSGISVSPGKIFILNKKGIEDSLEYAEKIKFPVVIKPTNSGHGNGVFSFIENILELREAINLYSSEVKENHFLLEKHFFGEEYRIFYTKKGFMAVVHRTPASIVGDGKRSIRELIDKENYKRLNPRVNCLCSIKVEDVMLNFIKKKGLVLDSVPKKNQKVELRSSTNVTMGGFCEDITDKIHSSVKSLAKKVFESFPEISIMGLDLICQDISKSLSKQEYIICELNSFPGLSLHTVPGKGKSRNSPEAIVDILYGSKL